MKIHILQNKQKAGNAYFWITIEVLLLISLVFIWTCFNLVYASTQRKYSPMSAEEARRLVEKVIENHEVPSPVGSLSYWKLPETGLDVQGIKINDNDYIIFASAKSSSTYSILKQNLPELLEMEKIAMEKESAWMVFVVNGILFSSVDFEIVNNPIFTDSGKKWARAKQVIGKGGYLWWIDKEGILLKSYGDEKYLIAFKEPIKNFPLNYSDFLPVYPVDFSISPEESAGILVKVAGQIIQLK